MNRAIAQAFLDADWMAKGWSAMKHGLPYLPPRILIDPPTSDSSSSTSTDKSTVVETTTGQTVDASQPIPNPNVVPPVPSVPVQQPTTAPVASAPPQPAKPEPTITPIPQSVLKDPVPTSPGPFTIPTWAKVAGIGSAITGPLLGLAGLYAWMNPPKIPAPTNTTIQQKGPEYDDLPKWLDENGFATGDGSASTTYRKAPAGSR